MKYQINKYCWLFLLIIVVLIASTNPAPKQGQAADSDIYLSISSDSYIPPAYLGKALPARGSTIEAVVTLLAKNVDPAVLNYTWFLDNTRQANQSGINKQRFTFEATNISGQSHQLVVNVSSSTLGFRAQKTIDIKIISPDLILYPAEQQPLINQIPFSLDLTSNQQLNFIARPFFFNVTSPSDLNFSWRLGEKVANQSNPEKPYAFSLKANDIEKAITNNLQVSAQNPNNRQTAQTQKIINLIP